MLRKLFIYRIVNKHSGKMYIGWTVDPHRRWRKHQSSARGPSRSAIHRAIAKYGVDSFSFEIIEEMLGTVKGAHQREIEHIARANSYWPNGYNLTRGGDGARELGALAAAAYARRKQEDPAALTEMCIAREKKGRARRSPGQASESAKRMWAQRSPEMRAEIRDKLVAAHAKRPVEARRIAAQAAHTKYTPEERSARAAHASRSRSEACVTALGQKNGERLRSLSKEERSRISKLGVAAYKAKYTPEQRSEIAHKIWATRRKRAAERLLGNPE